MRSHRPAAQAAGRSADWSTQRIGAEIVVPWMLKQLKAQSRPALAGAH
jgi:hypothetical protein